MAKWEELQVAVDENAARERAEAIEREMLWRKNYRTSTFGRVLLSIAGLFALHGCISFCVATDPVLVWGQDWMASGWTIAMCLLIIPVLVLVLLAVGIGFLKTVTPERNRGLYLLGLAITALGVFSPLLFACMGWTEFFLVVVFTVAPQLVGILLVSAAFLREDHLGDILVKRCVTWMAGLYGFAAVATAAAAMRANALAGLLVISLWLAAAFAAYLAYLAVYGCEMPWRWTGFPRAGRGRIVIATVFAVAVMSISGGLAGIQLTKVDLEIISALSSGNGVVDIVVINHGGWPADGELVLYGESGGNLTELCRTSRVDGFGRWLARVDAGANVTFGEDLVLHYKGTPVSRSFVGSGDNSCIIAYPAVFAVVGAAILRGKKKAWRA
ncbi:MAG: hypothetical protein V1934_04895 [Methanobacteriota archaeon]